MANIEDLIASTDVRAYSKGVSTGFVDLNECTGGFLPGALWLVIGTPGVGRTLLATCFASHASVRERAQTSLVLGGEPRPVALLNLYCQLGRVPAARVQRGSESSEEMARLAEARRLLSGSPLSVWGDGDGLFRDHRDEFNAMCNAADAGPGSGRIVVIDDFDRFHGLAGGEEVTLMLDRLRTLRARAIAQQSTVIVTLPEEDWLDDGQARPEIRRDVDVILRIVQPDMFAPDSPRAGETDFVLLRNRTGPSQTCTVSFLGHYRRFVDMSSG